MKYETKGQSHPPNLHDPDEVIAAIDAYLKRCEETGELVGNLGLYECLHITRFDWSNAKLGKSRTKIAPECISIIQKAITGIGVYREALLTLDKPPLPVGTLMEMHKFFDWGERRTKSRRTRQEGDKQ